MPLYKWYGIDLQGSTHHGTIYVYSQKQLEEALLKEDVAVISSSVTVPWSWWRGPTKYMFISFFDALASLLEAGVFLDTALVLLKKKQLHPGFQLLIGDIQCALHDGISFAQALSSYEPVFGSCALELIIAGEQVNALPQALRLVVHYYTNQVEFSQRVRGVALLPVITFCFFLVIAFVILAYVVPVFASMFLAAQKDIPWITRILLRISNWCASISLLSMGTTLLVPYILLKRYSNSYHIKKIKDTCLLYVPFFGRLIYEQTIYQFLQATALHLRGGIHELPALQSASVGLENEYIRFHVQIMIKNIQQGQSFADALSESSLKLHDEVQAILVVGEESGTLASSLERSAQWYKQEVERLLHVISSLVQPCLMIFLGLCITALIFAVYMPVLQLSYVIT